jgi:solute carrier family 10 (sodium/bile acid cotransporter), member 7
LPQVLVPTVIGKLLRSFSQRVRTFVAAHKTGLSIFSHVNLALIIWQNLRCRSLLRVSGRGHSQGVRCHVGDMPANFCCKSARCLFHSASREDLVHQRFVNILLIIVASAVVHLIYLVFNAAAVLALRLPVREGIAVLIMASQKSAPVAVTVIT